MTARSKLLWGLALAAGVVLSVFVPKSKGQQDLPVSALPQTSTYSTNALLYLDDGPAGDPASNKKIKVVDMLSNVITQNFSGSIISSGLVLTNPLVFESQNYQYLIFANPQGLNITDLKNNLSLIATTNGSVVVSSNLVVLGNIYGGITNSTNATPPNIVPASPTNSGLSTASQFMKSGRYQAGHKPTPPMGFNPWYSYGSGTTEANMIGAIDYYLTNNLTQLGFEYFNMDGGWQQTNGLGSTIRSNGHMVWDPVKFPHAVGSGSWVEHARTNGLKAGIWQESGFYPFGNATTPPNVNSVGGPFSVGYIETDAADFATWGFDYVKMDAGDADGLNQSYFLSLIHSNRPSAIIENGVFGVYQNIWESANVIRPSGIYGDIGSWTTLWQWVDWHTAHYQMYGPDHWAYVDMFQTTWGDANSAPGPNGPEMRAVTDSRAQVSMGAMLGSPFIVSGYNYFNGWLYTNREVIACDQDVFVNCAKKVYTNNLVETYVKKSGNFPNSKYVALVNRSPSPVSCSITVDPSSIPGGAFSVRDLWSQTYVAYATNSWATNVGANDLALLRADPGIVPPFPYGTNYLSDYHYMPVWTNSFYTNSGGGHLAGDAAFALPVQLNTSPNGQFGLRLGGTNYAKGFGALANSEFQYFVGGQATLLHFTAGVDDEVSGGGNYVWTIYGDGTQLAITTNLTGAIPFSSGIYWTTNITIPAGTQVLDFKATYMGTSDVNNHCDLVNCYIVCPFPKYGP